MATPAQPTILSGQRGFGSTYTKVMDQDFVGSGPFTGSANFSIEDMEGSNASEHRAGNSGQDENGVDGPNNVVAGKRWAAWYNDHLDKTLVQTSRGLRMKGHYTNEPDPTRIDYWDEGENIPASSTRLYTAMIRSYARKYDNALGYQVLDDSQAIKIYGPGHFYEIDLDLSEQLPDGFRFSWWLGTAANADGDVDVYDASANDGAGGWVRSYNMYDGNPAGGCEIDILEIERAPFPNENMFLMKVISANDSSGNTPNGQKDFTSLNLRSGKHKFGFLHTATGLYWFVDGVQVQEDEVRIPLVLMGQILSREMNTGVDSGDAPAANGTKLPRDTGLFGSNVYRFRDNFINDAVYVEYCCVWSVDDDVTPPVDPPVTTVAITQPFAKISSNAVVQGTVYTLDFVVPEDVDPDTLTVIWTHSFGSSATWVGSNEGLRVHLYVVNDVPVAFDEDIDCNVQGLPDKYDP